MTREEAKFILAAYRADGRDSDDAVFAEALELARKDPELREWFAREQAHDAQVSARLRELSAPVGTREAILAGLRASGGKVSHVGRYVTLASAAAAAAVVYIGVRASLKEPAIPEKRRFLKWRNR